MVSSLRQKTPLFLNHKEPSTTNHAHMVGLFLRAALSVWQEDSFDYAGADRDYAREFRGYGIDVDHLSPGEAARQINARAIGVELAVALDDWAVVQAMLRARSNRKDAERRLRQIKHLFAVARAADGDRFRNQLRGAFERHDTKALEELVQSASIEALPRQTIVFFGGTLRGWACHPGSGCATSSAAAASRRLLDQFRPCPCLQRYAASVFG